MTERIGPLLVLLVAGAGCVGSWTDGRDAAVGPDDGTLRWLLPGPSEVPTGYELAADPDGNAIEGGNPGRPTAETMDWIAMMTGAEKAPSDSVAVRYGDTKRDDEAVVVVAMRFDASQATADWRSFDGWAEHADASGETDEEAEEDDGFAIFISVCGLRPYYGFVRGNDAVLVLGTSADEVQSDRVFRAAAGLARGLAARSDGTDICTEQERRVNDQMHGGAVLVAGTGRREDAESVAAQGLQRGPLSPGSSNWFAADAVPSVCVAVSTEGEQVLLDAEDGSGEPVAVDWREHAVDDSTVVAGDVHSGGQVWIKVTAPAGGVEVPTYWVVALDEPCDDVLGLDDGDDGEDVQQVDGNDDVRHEAQPIGLGTTAGAIDVIGDMDWYSLTTDQETDGDPQMCAALEFDDDLLLTVNAFDGSGTAEVDFERATGSFQLTFTTERGRIDLQVYAGDAGSPVGPYDLTLATGACP